MFYGPAENKNSETRKKIKLCFACYFFPEVGRTVKINKLCSWYSWKQTSSNKLHSYWSNVNVSQLAGTWKLCTRTVAQIVQPTVVQWLALITLVWKMDTGVKAWFSVSLRRNGKEHWRLIRECSLDKSLSDVSISGVTDVECLLTKTYVGKTDDKLDEEANLGMPLTALRVAAAFEFRFIRFDVMDSRERESVASTSTSNAFTMMMVSATTSCHLPDKKNWF